MEIYSTEEQQAEAIKGFFKENGLTIAVGIIGGLSIMWGWKWYNTSQLQASESASDAYSQLIENAGKADSDVLAKSDDFIKNNAGSNYSVLAAFVAAKEAVEAKELDKAAEKLNWVVANTQVAELKAVALVRLARIQVELNKLDEALANLNKPMPTSYDATKAEIKGDIFIAKGEKDKAREQYQIAIDANGAENNPLLQMKLDNLAVAEPKL